MRGLRTFSVRGPAAAAGVVRVAAPPSFARHFFSSGSTLSA